MNNDFEIRTIVSEEHAPELMFLIRDYFEKAGIKDYNSIEAINLHALKDHENEFLLDKASRVPIEN